MYRILSRFSCFHWSLLCDNRAGPHVSASPLAASNFPVGTKVMSSSVTFVAKRRKGYILGDQTYSCMKNSNIVFRILVNNDWMATKNKYSIYIVYHLIIYIYSGSQVGRESGSLYKRGCSSLYKRFPKIGVPPNHPAIGVSSFMEPPTLVS